MIESTKPPADIQAILTVIGRRKREYEEGKDRRLDLHGVHIRGVGIGDAHLEGAILKGAQLKGARLHGAHLEGAMGLLQEQVDSAFGDEETVLPDGLERPAHWVKKPGTDQSLV